MATDLSTWRPAVADVAAIIPTRTGPEGVFDSTTVPTDAEVAGVIRQVQSEVTLRVGDVPASLCVVPSGGTVGESPAGHVVAVGAAAYVEGDFYPDMSLGGAGSPAERLWTQYQSLLTSLATAVQAAESGTDPGNSPAPSWTFPDTVGYGRATTPWESY